MCPAPPLSFRRVASGFALSLDVNVRFGSCTGAGIFRSLRIVTSEPIPLESITGSGETEHGGRVTFTDAH